MDQATSPRLTDNAIDAGQLAPDDNDAQEINGVPANGAPLDDLLGAGRVFSELSIASLKANREVCDASGYSSPGQDNTRQQYHAWFKEAERCGDTDAGGDGLKSAMSNFENSWYIASALTMTVGFALIMLKPEGQNPGSLSDQIATLSFLVLVLAGTVNAILGVWWAGHQVPQVHWHPAAHMSKFWFASMNTTLGHAQQFAKISIEQLVLSLLPLCYLHHGTMGLVLATASVGYLRLQLRTWAALSQQMRAAYQQGIESGLPVAVNVSDVPQSCRAPYTEGLMGLITCQLVGSACFATRWAHDRAGDADNTRYYEKVVDVEA